MKTTLKSIFVLSLSTFVMACSQPKEDSHEGHAHNEESKHEVSSPVSTAVSLKNENLNAIYPHYTQLTNALTAGDVAKAKVAALAIEAGAKEMKGAEKLASTAAEITATANLEAQRATFSNLNNTFIELLKASGTDAGALYIAHCPMALDDQGAYWVSNVKEIRNPYFGDSMLTCGSVKETIQ